MKNTDDKYFFTSLFYRKAAMGVIWMNWVEEDQSFERKQNCFKVIFVENRLGILSSK